MLRYASDILDTGFIIFCIFAGAISLVILVLGVLNFKRAGGRRATIAVQALGALAIWTVLTVVVVIVDLGFLITAEYAALQSHVELDSPSRAAVFIGGGFLIYALAGAALIYWTKRQTRRMPAMGLSC